MQIASYFSNGLSPSTPSQVSAATGAGSQNSNTPAPVEQVAPNSEDKRFDRLIKAPFSASGNAADGETISDLQEDKSCQTCESRTYQDGSNDPSVSFKSPTSVPVGSEASAVMGHEREHVANETAKAKENNRQVVSQAIRIYTSICPECKRVYVSGGTTTTVTASDNTKGKQDQQGKALDMAI